MDEDIGQVTIDLKSLLDSKLPNMFLLKYYNDLSERRVWLNEDVTDDSMYELIHYILKFNQEDKDIPIEKRKPIRLFFNSLGGDLDDQTAISQFIELSKTPIYGYGIGVIASAASLIYMSCHKKFILKGAYFIIHQGSAQLKGNYGDISAAMDDYNKVIEEMTEFIIARTKFTSDEVREKIKRDWYVRSTEAVEKGLADKIITDIDLFY